jgi:hypothetical protein
MTLDLSSWAPSGQRTLPRGRHMRRDPGAAAPAAAERSDGPRVFRLSGYDCLH